MSVPVEVAHVSLWQAIRLVAGREIGVKLRDKVFLFGTVFFLVITAAATIVPALLDGGGSSVAVVQSDTRTADTLRRADLDVRTVADAAAAERLVRDGEVDAAVVADDGPNGVKVLAMDETPDDVVGALSTSPPVQLLDPNAQDPILATLIPLGFGLIFFFTSITFGIQIAQSVTEEKQTRIVEILVSTVPVRALLAGKVIASSLLALGQILLITVVAIVGARVAGANTLLDPLGPALGWFLPFFVVGFVLLAALWAVAGALVSRIEDLAGSTMPIQIVVMVPFFAVAFFHDNETALTVMSYVPLSAPTAMPIRLFFGQAAWWEPVLSLGLLVVMAAALLALGARVYEGSLLRTSGRTKLLTAWRAANTP